MSDSWIDRTFQPVLTAPAPQLRLFPVWLLLGPRQVGKSSLLDRCADGHAYVSLDDLDTRERANRDPLTTTIWHATPACPPARPGAG